MSVAVTHRLFTVEEYHKMAESGILGEDDRVELIRGEIVQMSPIGSRHAACVARLATLFHKVVGDQAIVWTQNPIRLSQDSEPQPDVALLQPRPDFYADALPSAGDAFLVLEVAETSLDADRDVKASLYAEAGIPEFWLVELSARRVEVYRNPQGGAYRETRTYARSDRLAPRAFPEWEIELQGVL